MEKETKVALIIVACLFATVIAGLYVANNNEHSHTCSGCDNHSHHSTINYDLELQRERSAGIAYQVTR